MRSTNKQGDKAICLYSGNSHSVCPVGRVLLQRLVIQAQDQQRDYTLPEPSTQEQSWLEIYRSEGVMFSVVLKGPTSYEMRFAVADLKSISFATDRKTLSIDFSTTPTCFKFPKITPCNKFHEVDAVNIHTLVLYFRAADISVELVRVIYDEFNSRKDKVTRSQRKRPRTACEDCDCCEFYQDELRMANKGRIEAEKREQAKDKELESIASTGMTADFERDFYTPVVYTSHKLQTEISEIKRTLTYEQWLVPSRVMGMFDPEVLANANINEELASVLMNETLANPNFSPSNKPLLDKIRRKYGEEILQDVLRCRAEIDKYNASAGHPVLVAWDFDEDRELTPSEMVKIAVNKTRELSQANEDLTKEKEDLKSQNEELQHRIKHMRLGAPPPTNTIRVPMITDIEPDDEDEEEQQEQEQEQGRSCTIM